MKISANTTISGIAAIVLALVFLPLSGCVPQALSHEEIHPGAHSETHSETTSEGHSEAEHHDHQIIVTSPVRKDVISTQFYVCQIHSCKHIDIRALEGGYLKEVDVNEGQAVKKGELMFKILPVLYKARLDSEVAEAKRLEIELKNANDLLKKNFLAAPAIALKAAELTKAQAKVSLAQAEFDFTEIKAPFDGIVDRQHSQVGSLIDDGDVLTTFSDNSLMWVYFNVPEARYLEYKAELDKGDKDAQRLEIELKLANGKIFPQHGKIGAIEADFNNTTGNIAFRADFSNPESLLRNGQTGTILIHRTLKDVVVIPQRATFETLDKRYAYVVDKDNVVHQRDLTIGSVQEDIFVIDKGLDKGDKIILEGLRQVRDGDKIEYEFRAPEKVLSEMKYHAE
jgi:membrane fusion protein (multidrug efflux system)